MNQHQKLALNHYKPTYFYQLPRDLTDFRAHSFELRHTTVRFYIHEVVKRQRPLSWLKSLLGIRQNSGTYDAIEKRLAAEFHTVCSVWEVIE